MGAERLRGGTAPVSDSTRSLSKSIDLLSANRIRRQDHQPGIVRRNKMRHLEEAVEHTLHECQISDQTAVRHAQGSLFRLWVRVLANVLLHYGDGDALESLSRS